MPVFFRVVGGRCRINQVMPVLPNGPFYTAQPNILVAESHSLFYLHTGCATLLRHPFGAVFSAKTFFLPKICVNAPFFQSLNRSVIFVA